MQSLNTHIGRRETKMLSREAGTRRTFRTEHPVLADNQR